MISPRPFGFRLRILVFVLNMTAINNIKTRNSSEDETDLPERDIGIAVPLLRLTPLTEGFAWDDLRKIFRIGQRMAKVTHGKDILPKVLTPWAGHTNVTDDRNERSERSI